MKNLLFAASFLISVQMLAQASEPAKLSISGTAKISVKPTLTVVSLDIRSSNDSYAGTVEELTRRVDMLVSVLKDIKFPENKIITSNFSVDQTYAYIDGVRKATGFNGVQNLKVQFEQDKKRLLEVLTSVTSSHADPEITVSFDLDAASKEKLKQELMLKAVNDAKSKATLIAEQADYKVSGIKEIQYGLATAQIPVSPGARVFEMASTSDAQVSNFEVSDLTFSDQVLIVFEIVPK